MMTPNETLQLSRLRAEELEAAKALQDAKYAASKAQSNHYHARNRYKAKRDEVSAFLKAHPEG
jgi:hypothetical protein